MERVDCVAAILYNSRGQVLLQQRDNKPGLHSPGYWTLWGGRVEEGETPDQAIRRELNEELELVDVPLTWWQMYERPWREGIVIEQHVYIAPFDRPAESLTLHEGQALRYFSRTELQDLPIAFIFNEVLGSFFQAGINQNKRDSQEIWEERYVRYGAGAGFNYDPWLETWLPELDHACQQFGSRRVLDLGCGRGHDSRYLGAHGFDPVAADFSFTALRLAETLGGASCRVNLDLRRGLPFASGVFAVIVANLSLHYFPWQQTVAALEEVRGCLAQNGLLLARFNSTNDVNYGAIGYPEIEPHMYFVDGMNKRFFDRPDLERLFRAGWQILHLEEFAIQRYGDPKVVWEIVARQG